MAKKKRTIYAMMHKYAAGVSLLAFVVMVLGSFDGDVAVTTVVMRACIVMIVISLVARIVMRILTTYEEVNRG